MDITGTSGNDALNGTSAEDLFKLFQGGDDTANGKGGNDVFELRGAFTARDTLIGGGGIDTLELKGDYSAGVRFKAATISGVEVINFARDFSYSLTTNDANVAAGNTLVVDALALRAADQLIFDGGAERDGMFDVFTGAGDDTVTGGAGADRMRFQTGGDDTASGGGGSDLFIMGGAFGAGDAIFGGQGQDTIVIQGDYGGGLTVTASMVSRVETLLLGEGASYSIDWQAAFRGTLVVDTTAFLGEPLDFNGSSLASGAFHFVLGASSDYVLRGGGGGDIFDLPTATDPVIHGGNGDDTVNFADNYTGFDLVKGGDGFDTVAFDGEYGSGLFLTQAHVVDLGDVGLYEIENLVFKGGHSYDVIVQSDLTNDNGPLRVTAGSLGAGETLELDLTSSLVTGHTVTGGHGADTILCSAGSDRVEGGEGADAITAGDSFTELAYATGDSNGTARDVVTGVDWAMDQFDVPVDVADATAGTLEELNEAFFDADIKEAVDPVFVDFQAIIVSVEGGDLAGRDFLIVDANGNAVYDAGIDLAIELVDQTHVGSFSENSFI